MSLTELIFSNQVVVLSLLVAGILLLVAVILAVGFSLRGALQRSAARRATRLVEALAAEPPTWDVPPEEVQPVAAPEPAVAAPPKPTAAPPAAQGGQSAGAPAGTKPAPAVPAPVATPTAATPETPQESAEASAMNDILSNVFSDEERTARFEILLGNSGEIDIQHLQALSERVAEGLRARQTINKSSSIRTSTKEALA